MPAAADAAIARRDRPALRADSRRSVHHNAPSHCEREDRRRNRAGKDHGRVDHREAAINVFTWSPAPMAAAIVAVPTPTTAATRTPATMDGSASGSSTCRSSSRGVIPIATPASRIAGSMPFKPAIVVRVDRQEAVEDQHEAGGARPHAADERHR